MYLAKTGQGDFMIEKLAEGIAKVAQALYLKPFKSPSSPIVL